MAAWLSSTYDFEDAELRQGPLDAAIDEHLSCGFLSVDSSPKVREAKDLHEVVAKLQKEYEDLHEETAVLEDCLKYAGVISDCMLLEARGRRRGVAALRHVVQLQELAVSIGHTSGLEAFQNFSATASIMRTSMWPTFSELEKKLAPQFCVVGGSDGNRALDSIAMLDTETSSWFSLPSMPAPRWGFASAAEGSCLYLAGGMGGAGQVFGAVECLEHRSQSWFALPSMPTPRDSSAAVVSAGFLYVIGGRVSRQDGGQPLGIVERLNLKTEKWSELPPLLIPCHSCAVGVIKGHLYVIGGCDAEGHTLNRVERLNLEEPIEWISVASMSTPRHMCAAAALGGFLYVVGGINDAGDPLDSMEAFDPGKSSKIESEEHGYLITAAANANIIDGSWSQQPHMPTPRHRCAAAAVSGRLLVAGGACNLWLEALAVVELFDPKKGTWLELPPMPTPRDRCGAVALQ